MASVMDSFKNDVIDLESLPRFEEVEFQSISGNYLLKSNFQTGIFFLFILSGWIGLYYYEIGTSYLPVALAGIVILFGFKFWNNLMMQKKYGYALRERDILYRRGYIINSITIVPLNRIQHVAVSRDALDKILNISSLRIFTAGGSGSDISIPGLNPDLAASLKEALASRLTPNED
ncbi:PH domain-containing protein [Antarcticibacterium arcticum]|uniref:PH domain-containing protein n=1 Tax=Antarcticibacterium arcticum TaxID=2585771 RepID=A0A5B8YET8_9FLAO|nr:PH domain-containing protein [Antarcticibacterium arcticum]QED36482.1 PH domain-containing protein [Antarcticibacterium arcticum]